MKRIAALCTVLGLWISPAFSAPMLYEFTGAQFDQMSYDAGPPPIDRDYFGPYDATQRVTFSFTTQGLLPTNAVIRNMQNVEDLSTGTRAWVAPLASNLKISDGLDIPERETNGFTTEIETDANGLIVAWTVSYVNTGHQFQQRIATSSDIGDSARYDDLEYQRACQPGETALYCGLGGTTTLDRETASASTATIGSWRVTALPAPVPLPAGLVLLTTGVALLGWRARRLNRV